MGTLIEEVELLRQIPLFGAIDTPQLKLLVFASKRLSWESGDVVFHQGEASDAAYLVIEGKAEVYAEVDDEEIQLAEIGAHEIIGEIGILCDIPRTASIRAKEPLTMLKIRKDHFLSLIEDFPELSMALMRELAGRLHQASVELTATRQKLEKKDK